MGRATTMLLAATLLCLLSGALAADEKKPGPGDIPPTELTLKYEKGDRFVWFYKLVSTTVVSQGPESMMNVTLSQVFSIRCEVLEVKSGWPAKVKFDVLKHDVEASAGAPLKFKTSLKDHWFVATLAEEQPFHFKVVEKDPDFPEGTEVKETLRNLILVPFPLPRKTVDGKASWEASEYFVAQYFAGVFEQACPVTARLVRVGRDKESRQIAEVLVTARADEKKNEDGFSAHAYGDMSRKVTFDLQKGRVLAFKEKSALTAKAVSEERTLTSTVRIEIESNVAY
jgi:hypothetical protein